MPLNRAFIPVRLIHCGKRQPERWRKISSSSCYAQLIPFEECSLLWAWKAEGTEWGTLIHLGTSWRINAHSWAKLVSASTPQRHASTLSLQWNRFPGGRREVRYPWNGPLKFRATGEPKRGFLIQWADLALRGHCTPPRSVHLKPLQPPE